MQHYIFVSILINRNKEIRTMKNFKKLNQLLTIIAFVSVLFACEKESDDTGEPDNSTFNVTISTPENDTEFNLGDDISISATIIDTEDVLESVNFYFDNEIVKTITEAPYSISINTEDYSEGDHTIKAEAINSTGLKKENSININLIKSEALEIVSPGDRITEDQTWEGNKIYKLREGTQIQATVTIEPGCIIKVEGHLKIVSDGKIIANGTASNPITFTSKNKNIGGDNTNPNPEIGDWDNIVLGTSGNIFNYCIFEYGDETVRDYENDLTYTFTNCTFRHGYFGLNLSRVAATDSKIENCRFYSNTTPMSISAHIKIGNTNHFTSEDGTLKNMMQHISLMVIGVSPGTVEIKKDVTLTETSIAYATYFYIDISNNSKFSLKEGVVLKMGKMGPTAIEYEEGSEIIMEKDSYITSHNDNSLLGDPESDDVPTNEDWLGIAKGNDYIENMDNVLYSKYSSK